MLRRMRNQGMAAAAALNAPQMQLLTQANQLYAAGQPGQAAPLFARLAGAMESANHPRRAANLHAQAAHAYADCSAEQSSLAHARSALNLFIQYKMVQRTPVFYANITRKLDGHNMKASADALRQEFGQKIAGMPAVAQPTAAAHAALPTNCPKCGAPLHPTEVSWTDTITAECAYCGAAIRTG